MKKFILIVSSLVAFSFFAGGTANATSTATCTVTKVAYQSWTSAKYFYVGCSDGNYYAAFLVGAGQCAASDIDTIKLWQSLATAAQLSGKQLTIIYNPNVGSCGAKTLFEMSMQ
jgi:hypothetical protein